MASLDELRKRLPSLEGLSDEQAVRYLEQRYQVPAATIAKNLGVSLPVPAAPPAPKRSLFAVANDTVIEAANAAAGTAGSIANFVSPGNRFSQGVDEFIREGEASQSDAVKADKARFRDRMEGAQGFGDEVAAVGGYIADSPLQALAQAAGSIAVPGTAMKVAGALGGGAKTGLAIGAGIGGAGAGGDAAGTAYELAKEAGASDEEATAAARSASVIPGIVGAAGGVIGAERLLAGAKGFGGNWAARAVKTAGVEGAQEGFEEGITQYEGQRAAVPFDPTIDPMKGVAGAAAMGAALGGAAGGGVSLLSPAPAPMPDKKAEADAALTALGSAGSVEEAVALATKATDIPVLPTRDPNSAKMVKARNAGTLAWVRDLEREDQTTALGLMALLGNPRTPETVRRSVSGQLDALERKARAIPTGEASEVLPTGEVFDDQDIPTGEATELRTGMAIDGQNVYDPDLTWEQRRERLRRAAGLPPAVESTELLPTGDATEVEQIPTPDVLEDIPAGDAAEVLPVGDAAEVLPTPDVIEDAPPLPTGEATDIEPEQADTELLLTGDGMPYGTRSAAYVRAKREGLPPDAVVDVPGGWAVKKESTGEQSDMAATPAEPAGARDGRSADAGRGGVPVGSVPAEPGAVVQPAARAGASGGANQPVADAGGADPALKVKTLSAQWADAVARGDMAEAKRLNDAIVEAKKPAAPPPAPAPQAAAPATETREQAIRRVWGATPRKLNEWTPMSVSVGEGDKRRTNDMLVIQRKARGDGQGDATITMRVLRMGKLLASDPAEPLVFTFKLTGENKVEQVGRARVPTPEDIAQWEGVGFAVPGRKAEAPKPVEPASESKTAAASTSESAPVASESEPERVKVMTRFGQNVYVNRADLDSDKDRFQHFTSTGKSLGIIVRDNLDPTGEKRAESNQEDADNPLFEVIGTREGRAFASEAAAARERSMRGLDNTYDIVPMSGGFALKRKAPALEPPAPPAPEPAPQVSTRTPEPPAPGGFDSEAWDKERSDRIKASREAGNVHLDTLEPYVETMRGKAIRSVHDPKVKGTIFTVDNNRNVYVDWADAYSQEKEGAVPMQYGRRKFMQSTLGPRDLKDYVLDEAKAPAPAPTNPPAPAAQTRPEELIELRKRASVLKQLLRCLL